MTFESSIFQFLSFSAHHQWYILNNRIQMEFGTLRVFCNLKVLPCKGSLKDPQSVQNRSLLMLLMNWNDCEQYLKCNFGASLVAQWLRTHLLMQGTRVQALVQENPTCRGATKSVSHDY